MPRDEGSGTYRSGGKVHSKRSGKKDSDHQYRISTDQSHLPAGRAMSKTMKVGSKSGDQARDPLGKPKKAASKALDEQVAATRGVIGTKPRGTGTTGNIPMPERGGSVTQDNLTGINTMTSPDKPMVGDDLKTMNMRKRAARMGGAAAAEAPTEAMQAVSRRPAGKGRTGQ